MSVLLYRLGGGLARFRIVVVGAWLLVLAAVVGSNVALGDHYDDTFTIPGTQSQTGSDLLLDRFDQSGTTAQLIFTARSGKITDAQNAAEVKKVAAAVNAVPEVEMSNPLGPPPGQSQPVLSKDGRSTLGQASFDQKLPSDETLDAVLAAGRTPDGSPVTTHVGGDAYKTSNEPSKVPELLGLLVSFLILCVTFGSLLTAGMPIVTALVGVTATLSAVVVTSHVVTVSSTSPTLAEMLGLAVGIDYALFILSRYRRQLEDRDVTPAVAMSRALATAGSAVVFAGTTVIIALTGLAVARIPVLTVMGLAAAAAVAVAVLIALTLLPAVALLFGERLRPRRRDPRRGLLRRARAPRERVSFRTRWIRLTTTRPVLTVVAVVAVLVVAALPAASLALALPDASTSPEDTPQRQTYDAITQAFGEGYNAPLTVTAGVITSSDPSKTVDKLARQIAALPGVVAVTQATPNQSGDTALVQVIPEAGQTAASTADLVNELRARSSSLEKKTGATDILVTGPTAINIDVSDRLAGALLPFAAIVIGLSLLLLMVVFRSVAVPVKATLGYLLSVGAALGAVVAVFQEGWLDGIFPGLSDGPIVSFLPIFVMGVLFGLAMDYEMFLVSAMREEYVRKHDPRDAVLQGFRASSIVVTAAALIMTSVFVAFIPGGSSTIKPIAFGLAVGVFVDAFLVRMTLVPAVLVLLGHRAWWLPAFLERRLPVVDVEGAAMHRKLDHEQWEAENGAGAVVAHDIVVVPGTAPVQLVVRHGRVTRLPVPAGHAAAWGGVLTGRRRPAAGEVVVDGLLLPEQRDAVQRVSALVDVGGAEDPRPYAEKVRERARVAAVGPRSRRRFVSDAGDLVARLLRDQEEPQVRAAAVEAALAVAGGARLVVLLERDAAAPSGPAVAALARALADEDATVLVVTEAPPTVAAQGRAEDAAREERQEARA